ncbi:MAG: phosphate acetyltransferase [Spirochaetia bacterium]
MNFVERQKFYAKKKQQRIVLPEGAERRIVMAANILIDEGLAKEVVLLGKQTEIEATAFEAKIDLSKFTIIDPEHSEYRRKFAQDYTELRKHKGMSEELAYTEIVDSLKFGALLLRNDYVDAMVAGVERTTGDVLLAGFTIVKTLPGVKSASSCMVMDLPDKKWGVEGNMIFADCSTIPDPTPQQLAEITIASCESCQKFLETDPICAMLSFSTKGSASHPDVDKVIEALKIVKEKRPDLNVDGEMQLDAAVIPDVAKKKAPTSPVAGKANVLIFPDLQSANIGYKLTQRFGNAGAYGPFMQGFAKPISDLSRGATVDDIVNTCAVLLAQG